MGCAKDLLQKLGSGENRASFIPRSELESLRLEEGRGEAGCRPGGERPGHLREVHSPAWPDAPEAWLARLSTVMTISAVTSKDGSLVIR